MFNSLTKKIALLFWAAGIMGILSSTTTAQAFRVTETFLKADEGRMAGPCPLRVVFNGYISANGPGVVEYTFARSDGATGPSYRMEFLKAGTQRVTTDWTLGDISALPRYEGWQTISILSPNPSESSRATGGFVINCETELKFGPAPKTTILDPPAAGHDGAQAYKQIAPALSAPHKQKLERELSELRTFAEKFQPALTEAQNKAGLDTGAMMAEFRRVAGEQDLAKRAQRAAEFNQKYEPQFLKSAKAAGIDLSEQRRQLMPLLHLSEEGVKEGKTLVLALEDGPPQPTLILPAPPDSEERILRPPFTTAGTLGGVTMANAATGHLFLSTDIYFAGSEQKLAFISQALPVTRGVRRVRVFASFDPVDHRLGGFAGLPLAGYSSSEAIVNLRVMEGGQERCRARESLGRVITAALGWGFPQGSRPATLSCEVIRSNPDDTTTYNLIAEIEGWAGTGGLGSSASVFMRGYLQQFQVHLHRR